MNNIYIFKHALFETGRRRINSVLLKKKRGSRTKSSAKDLTTISETLKKTIPDGSQTAEYSFHKGLFDPIVPRNPLKGVLNELFRLHSFLPLNQG